MITIRELREQLSRFPDDCPVIAGSDGNDLANFEIHTTTGGTVPNTDQRFVTILIGIHEERVESLFSHLFP